MDLAIFDKKLELGQVAADRATAAIGEAMGRNGEARVVAATGASQFEFLAALTTTEGIDWGRVEMFHLDEYPVPKDCCLADSGGAAREGPDSGI